MPNLDAYMTSYGLAWQPESGELWTVVNERDLLGSDLVPDYLTTVKDGGFYGWPYSYFGNHLDPRGEVSSGWTWSQRPSFQCSAGYEERLWLCRTVKQTGTSKEPEPNNAGQALRQRRLFMALPDDDLHALKESVRRRG